MSVIIEATAEGPNLFLQPKWFLFALVLYVLSNVVGRTIL